ncbi:MAG: hypothetical protein IJB73_01935 [Firmicutes bacterium]|nr:hypothetical protein [Bacillota bacterium]
MGVAPQTASYSTGVENFYANDIDYVSADALAAMALVADKYDVENFAAAIADAKAALELSYDAADYSATGLAKIAEIIATVDTATSGRDLANKTIAARKAIAAVNDTIESEAHNKALMDIEIKAYLQDLEVVARSVKTAKGNVKVTINADVDYIIENGYTVEYKFYRSEYSNKKFGAAKKVSAENVYTNTTGEKGTKYYYKAVIVAKNEAGEVVAQSPLKHCLYACRTWTK